MPASSWICSACADFPRNRPATWVSSRGSAPRTDLPWDVPWCGARATPGCWPSPGPSKAAAQLEGSKGFTKDLCRAHNIPTVLGTSPSQPAMTPSSRSWARASGRCVLSTATSTSSRRARVSWRRRAARSGERLVSGGDRGSGRGRDGRGPGDQERGCDCLLGVWSKAARKAFRMILPIQFVGRSILSFVTLFTIGALQ